MAVPSYIRARNKKVCMGLGVESESQDWLGSESLESGFNILERTEVGPNKWLC